VKRCASIAIASDSTLSRLASPPSRSRVSRSCDCASRSGAGPRRDDVLFGVIVVSHHTGGIARSRAMRATVACSKPCAATPGTRPERSRPGAWHDRRSSACESARPAADRLACLGWHGQGRMALCNRIELRAQPQHSMAAAFAFTGPDTRTDASVPRWRSMHSSRLRYNRLNTCSPLVVQRQQLRGCVQAARSP